MSVGSDQSWAMSGGGASAGVSGVGVGVQPRARSTAAISRGNVRAMSRLPNVEKCMETLARDTWCEFGKKHAPVPTWRLRSNVGWPSPWPTVSSVGRERVGGTRCRSGAPTFVRALVNCSGMDRPTRIHHLALRVADPTRALGFYGGVL